MRKPMTFRAFCEVVSGVVDTLPEPFHQWMENVAVEVHEWPTESDWASIDDDEDEPIDPDDVLYGLFIGVPITEQEYGVATPNIIKIFRQPLLRDFPDPAELRAEIRMTVLHELAHHFGYSERDLDEFEGRVGEN